MSEQSRLREGIDAAKRGDKATARRLLQQVLSVDGDNEMALMWMASVVDSLSERRFFLERALSINPKNDRAREALRRLGVENPAPRQQSPRSVNIPDSVVRRTGGTNSNNTNIYLVGAAVVGFIVVAVIVASVVSSLQPQATPGGVSQNAQATFDAILNPTSTSTPDRSTATATLLPGIVVSLDASILTPLPSTFTPTPTDTPAPTATPTVTPPALKSFKIIYSDTEQGASQPSLYQGNADGTGEVKLQSGDAGGFLEVNVDPSGKQLAFVRIVTDDGGNVAPQLFTASLDALDQPTQLTKLTGSTLAHPNWSPDGKQIVFSTNDSSTNDSSTSEQIAVINADGTDYQLLTNNTGRNSDPQYSPDGKLIVFASDVNSPNFSEIYTMPSTGGDLTQLTDVPNSYSPTFSPDGAKIAFINDQQGDGDIYVMDADGERPTLLTVDDGGAEDHDPVWSPDSRWILFAANRDGGDFRWYAIDMQSNVQAVTVPGRNPQSLSFVTR